MTVELENYHWERVEDSDTEPELWRYDGPANFSLLLEREPDGGWTWELDNFSMTGKLEPCELGEAQCAALTQSADFLEDMARTIAALGMFSSYLRLNGQAP
jgi:hypothetical protein